MRSSTSRLITENTWLQNWLRKALNSKFRVKTVLRFAILRQNLCFHIKFFMKWSLLSPLIISYDTKFWPYHCKFSIRRYYFSDLPIFLIFLPIFFILFTDNLMFDISITDKIIFRSFRYPICSFPSTS